MQNNSLQRIRILSLLLFLPFLMASAQQIKVTIQAPESVVVGKEFKVHYLVESDKVIKEPIVIKNMSGFEIVYGPSFSTSSSVQFKEGKREQVFTASSAYVLRAEEKGTFTLPRGEVVVDGKRYRSKEVKVGVKTIEDLVNVEAFVKVIPSRTKVSDSDTLTVTYKLYTTKEIKRLADVDLPIGNSFFVSDLTRSRQSFSEETIDGKVFQVVILRKLLLQPKREGVLSLPEGSINVEYVFPTGGKIRDAWGDVYEEYESVKKKLDVESVVIRVQNLIAI